MGRRLPEVICRQLPVFRDARGYYIQTYSACDEDTGSIPFQQDDISYSHFRVLRGFHGDPVTWKLVSCASGSIFLVVVRPEDMAWESFVLMPNIGTQVLVPPGYGVAHQVMSPDGAVFMYKQSTQYGAHEQFTIAWNDPRLEGLTWPIDNPILSERDRNA